LHICHYKKKLKHHSCVYETQDVPGILKQQGI